MLRRLFYAILIIIFFYFTYGLYLSRLRVEVTQEILPAIGAQKFHDYKGVINVHSDQGKGSRSFEDIVGAARARNLDFLTMTDLNDFDVDKKQDGYFDQVLVFHGGEYSYLGSRVLNFNARRTDHLQGIGRSQILFTDILSRKDANDAYGIFILAHPLKPGYQWSGDLPKGIDGIEVFNLRQIWQWSWINKRSSFFWTLLIYPFNPDLAFSRLLAHAAHEEIKHWDELNSLRPTIGYAGTQAESRIRLSRKSQVSYPSYDKLFSLVSNHVLLRSELTGNFSADRKKISEALKLGQFYISFDFLGEPRGFTAYMKNTNGDIIPMGAKRNIEEGWSLHINLPSRPLTRFETIIYKDGQKLLTSTSPSTEFTIHSPGSYRALVRVKIPLPIPDGNTWLPWIYTNNFYISSSESK